MTELERMLDDLVAAAPTSGSSWSEVVARARRPRRRRLAAAGAVVALALLVAVPPFSLGSRLRGLFGGTPVDVKRLFPLDLQRISAIAAGFNPHVPASKQEQLNRLKAASLRQIATRDGRAYFVAKWQRGGLCTAVGEVGQPDLFGAISCAPDFPSSRRVLDETVFHGGTSGVDDHVWRLEGFAVDAVAKVGLVTASGKLEAVTPVQDNVYVRTKGLPSERVLGIIAFDANENAIWCGWHAKCKTLLKAMKSAR
jgi:hypothetical protein